MRQPLDLAVVGNCAIAALIEPSGRIVWLCWPRLDGDPVFCALLDGEEPKAGFAEIELLGQVRAEQRYRRNTAVLETILEDARGNRLEIVDVAPRMRRFGRMFRPPMLVRQLRPLAGRPRIRIRYRPRFGWGRKRRSCAWGPTICDGWGHRRRCGLPPMLRSAS